MNSFVAPFMKKKMMMMIMIGADDFFSSGFSEGRYWTMSQNSRCWGNRI